MMHGASVFTPLPRISFSPLQTWSEPIPLFSLFHLVRAVRIATGALESSDGRPQHLQPRGLLPVILGVASHYEQLATAEPLL